MIRGILTGLWLVAILVAPRGAPATLSSGMLITNFVSATFASPSGEESSSISGIASDTCGPHVATTWVLVTDTPHLCMTGWKRPLSDGIGTPLVPAVRAPGDFLCYEIGFSNCGGFTGFSVTITDALPANVVKAQSLPGSFWVGGGYGSILTPWASSLGGPWVGGTNAGQQAPMYMRWIIGRVGMGKTGYVRYCVTVL